VLAEAPAFVLTFYLFLAYPMGRVEPPAARWLMGVLVVGVLAFFLPWALFSPVIAGGGPLTSCAPACPQSVVQIGTAPDLVEVAGKAETYTALAVTLAVLVVYALRIRAATRPQRRALAAVAVTSLLFMPAYFVVNFASQVLHAAPETVADLAWAIVVARILLPLGFLVALLQADRFASEALRALLQRLSERPTQEQWRDAVATALDDDELRLGYQDLVTETFREPDGTALELPPAEPHRAWVPIEQHGRPVAAMVVDETLAEDPELVHAAATATLVAVENGALEGELRETRARALEAGEVERRRIERDIHDTAQQRLVALRIHPHARRGAARRGPGPGADSSASTSRSSRRSRTCGRWRTAPRRTSSTARVSSRPAGRGRPLPDARAHRGRGCAPPPRGGRERRLLLLPGVLQNAAKHAGRGASVTIAISEFQGRIGFAVEDDGVGFDPATVQRGAGLDNLAERMHALGGTLGVDSRPGAGRASRATSPRRLASPASCESDESPLARA
jgi:signal transduction histidine kinase